MAATQTPPKKLCKNCGENEPKSGNICMDCHMKKHYEKRKVEDQIYIANNAKPCGGPCGETLPIEKFAWFNKEEQILQSKCRVCYNLARRRRPEEDAEENSDSDSGSDTQPRTKRRRIANSVASGMTHKYCAFHDCEHPVADFTVRDGYYKSCRKADSEKAKARREEDKEAKKLLKAVKSGAMELVPKVPPKTTTK